MNSQFPLIRKRRLRSSETLRRMLRETSLGVSDLIAPLFVVDWFTHKEEIPAMPGQYHHSIDSLLHECEELYSLGVPAVILFGVTDRKDPEGRSGADPHGIVQQAVKRIKQQLPAMLVITDVCLCEYTNHGHCGVLKNDEIDNDATLPILADIALSHAQAGADMVAPSDMMDGRVKLIRETLDHNGYSSIPIMAYSAKFASSFYGPFRDAAQSAPSFGDRRSYQMDPANGREALEEVSLDIDEGADIVMVKPALAYLDIIKSVRDSCNLPLAAYNVSGEYSMVKFAAEKGFIDEKMVMMEILYSIKRAGADLILTYFAKEAAACIKEQ